MRRVVKPPHPSLMPSRLVTCRHPCVWHQLVVPSSGALNTVQSALCVVTPRSTNPASSSRAVSGKRSSLPCCLPSLGAHCRLPLTPPSCYTPSSRAPPSLCTRTSPLARLSPLGCPSSREYISDRRVLPCPPGVILLLLCPPGISQPAVCVHTLEPATPCCVPPPLSTVPSSPSWY